MRQTFLWIALTIGCGGAAVETPPVVHSTQNEPTGPSEIVRARAAELEDAYLAAHALAPSDDEYDDDESMAPRCGWEDVGTVSVGVCGWGETERIEDTVGWVVSDEGVVELDESETFVEFEQGETYRELALPHLDRDPHAGLGALMRGVPVGVVSMGPEGLEHVALGWDVPRTVSDTMCGTAILRTPREEGDPISVDVLRAPDGSLVYDDAPCAHELDALAAAAEQAAWDARAALETAIASAAPSTPACVTPTAAQLRRARRAHPGGAPARDRGRRSRGRGGRRVRGERRRRRRSTARSRRRGGRRRERDAAVSRGIRGVSPDDRVGRARARFGVELPRNRGGPRPDGPRLRERLLRRRALVRRRGRRRSRWRREPRHDHGRVLVVPRGARELRGDLPRIPRRRREALRGQGLLRTERRHSGPLRARGAAGILESALFVDGHLFAWDGTAVVETPVPAITTALTVRDTRRAALATFRALVVTRGAAWARDTTAALVGCGVPETASASLVAAVIAAAPPP